MDIERIGRKFLNCSGANDKQCTSGYQTTTYVVYEKYADDRQANDFRFHGGTNGAV